MIPDSFTCFSCSASRLGGYVADVDSLPWLVRPFLCSGCVGNWALLMYTRWLAGPVLGRSMVFSASVAITEIYTHGITFPFSRSVLWGLSVIYSV